MPISHRERGLYWNSKRLDTPSPTPHPFEKNGGIIFFGIFDEHVWEMYPPPGTPWYQKFFLTTSMNISGKRKPPRNYDRVFMFI